MTLHFYQFLEAVRKWDGAGLASSVSQILCLIIKSWTSRISRIKQAAWHCSFMNSYIGVKVLCDNSIMFSWLNVSNIDNTLLLAVKLLISLSVSAVSMTHCVTLVTLSWLMTPCHAASRARDVMRRDTEDIDHSGAVLGVILIWSQSSASNEIMKCILILWVKGWVNFREIYNFDVNVWSFGLRPETQNKDAWIIVTRLIPINSNIAWPSHVLTKSHPWMVHKEQIWASKIGVFLINEGAVEGHEN